MAENRQPGALVGATGAVCRDAIATRTAALARGIRPHESVLAAANHETSDDWPNVVVTLAPDWRVIVCRDGLQWILQRRKKGGAERPWRAVGYCRTRNALMRLCATSCGPLDADVAAMLAALPDTIGGRARHD